MQGSANNLAYAEVTSKTIPEHNSVADGTPATDATAARRPQQPTAAVVLKRTISTSWWTEERIEELKVQFLAGYSAAIIARALETTRNAVLGKVHRLGLSNRLIVKVAKPIRCPRRILSEPRSQKTRQSLPALVPIISVITGTFATTRKSRPPVAEMTKNQLRAMLTQALHNTAKLAIVP